MDRKSIISLFIEAAIFIAIIMFGWNYYNNQLNTSEHNLRTACGRIEQLELKNGDLLTARDSYIAKSSELEELLGITQSEVRELKKTLGNKVAYISKLEAQIETGPIIIQKDSIVYIDKNIESHFKYNDQWLSLTGVTKISDNQGLTTINNIGMLAPLTVGLTDDYKIFVKTSNPYITFNSIEGAAIDGSKIAPKKKRFGWGIQLGFGVMYDVLDKDLSVGPYGGLGVEINF